MDKNSSKVIIIGAGISGLAAAEKLTSEGIEVLILEAQERVGGRLRTDRSLGFAFDEGASWIHGSDGNPITQVAEDAGASTFLTDDENLKVFDKDGSEYQEDGEKEYESFEEACAHVERKGDNEASFEDVFKEEYAEKMEDRLWKYMLSAYLEFDVGGDISKMNSGYYADDKMYNGVDVIMTNGYDLIAEHLAKDLDIRYNEKVSAIDYSSDKVKITSSGGSYEAEVVIVTVPLGVLKNGVIDFEPKLSDKKQQAIDGLEMGSVNKFLLTWDTAFWDTDLQYIGYTPDEFGKFNYFLNCSKFVNANALMTFGFGDYGEETESMGNEEIISEIMSHLKVIYGDQIPKPTNMLRTKWKSNEYTYGAYSFATVGVKTKAYDWLAENVDHKLFFAGEHTSRYYRGTVHGAYLSGIREAEQIIKFFK